MSTSTSIQAVGPLGSSLKEYDRTKPPQTQTTQQQSIPRIFLDAMTIREEVFVQEQSVPLENELDDQDATSVHLVLYASEQSQQPIGNIRILPAENELPTTLDKHRHIDGTSYTGSLKSAFHQDQEFFVTLGRLAIIKEYRGHDYATLLVRKALDHAVHIWPKKSAQWSGLVMIHAQQQVQRFWARCGFELDSDFGIWDEEGIDHVAMFIRV